MYLATPLLNTKHNLTIYISTNGLIPQNINTISTRILKARLGLVCHQDKKDEDSRTWHMIMCMCGIIFFNTMLLTAAFFFFSLHVFLRPWWSHCVQEIIVHETV